MSSVWSTSAMKSPPLLVCVTRSTGGGSVSAARWGCGTTLEVSLGWACCAPAGTAWAVKAAAPVSVTPFRKFRRPAIRGPQDFFDIGTLLCGGSQETTDALRIILGDRK